MTVQERERKNESKNARQVEEAGAGKAKNDKNKMRQLPFDLLTKKDTNQGHTI